MSGQQHNNNYDCPSRLYDGYTIYSGKYSNHYRRLPDSVILYNNEEIKVIPVRKSLTRPQLICDCDCILFLMLFCIAIIVHGDLWSGNYINVLIGIAFFFFSIQVLAVLAKYDPPFSQILSRAVKYQDTYIASSRVSR
mgnify:CR=1 FL=1